MSCADPDDLGWSDSQAVAGALHAAKKIPRSEGGQRHDGPQPDPMPPDTIDDLLRRLRDILPRDATLTITMPAAPWWERPGMKPEP